MYHRDHAHFASRQLHLLAQKCLPAIASHQAQPAQQLCIASKVTTQALRNRERILAMRHGKRYLIHHLLAKQEHFFLMATWAKPTAFARKPQQQLLSASASTYPSKPFRQIPTLRQAQDFQHSKNFSTTSLMTSRKTHILFDNTPGNAS